MDATIKTEETKILELNRTHKKPYKVGKLYFGRKATTRGAGWLVSANVDLSDPVQEFEIGKLARAYCEEERDAAKEKKVATTSSEVEINIPTGTGLTNIFDEVTDNDIV